MRLLSQNEVLEKTAALEAADSLGKILSHKWHDHIAGGLADKRSPADFPREDLIKGMSVEMEHTSDPSVACEIAMDHLMEDPHYYNHEQDMAKEVQDKLGHVLPREDGAIKLAELMGSHLAGITKEAIPNPFSAIKGLGAKLIGKVAPKAVGGVAHAAEGAAVHGAENVAAHAAEGAVGKVHPNVAPAVGPQSGGSLGGAAGFQKGPSVKRFGWGKAALGAGVLGAGYAALKGVPWAANKLEETSAMPLAYGGGWSATPYGYGNTPYGNGTATMGYGA
ncbi:hypothetical protein UFOVP276_39 [uncultured Caudovirales phage]|uniref:Uncharacterized protein n=1 Tax=uncultured Caudovirales phage TaxID=2100421 RepID=A0A6J5LL63_9CAUD|nr:hypothetical protein UFOVP127_176 [uncultured Caudovirales phage]CAB4134975.1 hypothetical protein UFOVP276_39 [uncultured Caudovirales phage]